MVAWEWFFNINLTQVLIPLGKRASVLAAKGTVDIILRVVVNTSKDTSVCAEEILLLSHVILTKVGPKGKILYMPFKSIKEGSYVSSKTFEFLESFFKALKKDSKNSKVLEDTYEPSLIDLKGMYSILPLGPTLVRITWLNSRISSAQTEVSLLVFTTTLRIISTVPLAARTEALFPKGINT